MPCINIVIRGTWKLILPKPKVLCFAIEKFQHNYMFTYNVQAIEIDENFVYLGIMFSYNSRFLKNNQRMVEQARKAMFSVLRKS